MVGKAEYMKVIADPCHDRFRVNRWLLLGKLLFRLFLYQC